jgi:predicted nucleic acid-binding protein
VIRPAAKVIHLDTGFLIRSLVLGTQESARLLGWLGDRRRVAVSTLAWGEFLCGPLGDLDEVGARRLAPAYLPVGIPEATEGARLFNLGGRRRGSLPDCIIAATAILAGAELATSNPADFERFVEAGLELAE